MRYRSLPTEVEAIQLGAVSDEELMDWLARHGVEYHITGAQEMVVTTTQGEAVQARNGEWIILDATPGTAYPCDPDVFAKKYEPAGEDREVGGSE